MILHLCLYANLWTILVVYGYNTNKVIHQNVSVLQFSDPIIGEKYKSSPHFDPCGMEHLYTLTNMFLDLIQNEGLPQAVITQEMLKSPVKVINANRGELLSHFLGMLLVALSGLILAVLLPFFGILFCCCRCAGNCGNKRDVIEKRRDPCRRFIYGFMMFILVLIMMFGLVCAFVTNEYIEHGIKALPNTLHQSITDYHLFLNNTDLEVDNLLKKNFRQLQLKLEESLDSSGNIVKTRLGEVSEAAAVDNLTEIVSRLGQIQDSLRIAVKYTKELQEQSLGLETKLTGIRSDLNNLIKECTDNTCAAALKTHNVSSLTVEVDFYKLPNLSSIVNNISALLKQDIEEEIRKGKDAFDQLSHTIQSTVNRTVPDIKFKIGKVGAQLASASDNISIALQSSHLRWAQASVREIEPHINEYSKYRWYACIGFCCGMLAIVFCFTLGLICGSCGRNHGNAYSDNSCSKGSGARFLMLGVVLVFIFSFYLLVAMTALFLIGGLLERVGCDVISNSSSLQFQQVVMLAQELDVDYPVSAARLDFVEVLRKCHHNESLYRALGFDEHDKVQVGRKVFQMFNLSDIKNYRQHYEVDAKLEEFLYHLNISPNVTVLTTQGQELLRRLKDTPVSRINFKVYFNMAQEKITAVNLPEAANYLRNIASLLPNSQQQKIRQLLDISTSLEDCQAKLVIPMIRKLELLKGVAEHLQKDSEFEGRSLQEAITELLEKAEKAQEFIQTKGKEELKKLAEDFIQEFTYLMDQYAEHVEYQVENGIGKCIPVSKAFNASFIGVCSEIILPFNGFWASLGWCTIICIPGLIIAIALSVLYRRVDPYPIPLVDSVNRKHGHGDREIYENRNGYLHDFSPGYRERVPLATASYLSSRQVDYTRGLEPMETATFTAYHPSSSSHRMQASRGNEYNQPPEYSKPPPYFFPGPS